MMILKWYLTDDEVPAADIRAERPCLLRARVIKSSGSSAETSRRHAEKEVEIQCIKKRIARCYYRVCRSTRRGRRRFFFFRRKTARVRGSVLVFDNRARTRNEKKKEEKETGLVVISDRCRSHRSYYTHTRARAGSEGICFVRVLRAPVVIVRECRARTAHLSAARYVFAQSLSPPT